MKRNLFFLIPLLFVLASCERESPLSDIELEDFSLVAPTLKIERNKSAEGSPSSSLEVWLYDRNSNPFELKGGKVTLNNESAKLKRSTSLLEAGGVPYYDGSELGDITLGKAYTLTLTLANGEQKTISARTPEQEINLEIPSTFDPNEGIEITWNAGTPYEKIEIDLVRDFGGERHSVPFLEVPSVALSKGRYLIPSEKIMEKPLLADKEKELPPLSSITITIKGTTNNGASIPSGFHKNAAVKIVFSDTKQAEVAAMN